MGFTEELKVLLVGNATSAIGAFRETGSASEALQSKTTITGQVMQKLGLQGVETGTLLKTAMVGGAVVAGAALAKFAIDGVQHFADATGAVRQFQRTLGGTAEDSSKLAAATQRMGIDADTATSAFGKLAKNIGEGKDTLAQWGVEIARNRDGSVNMSATLENISEKYKSIEDPAKRAAFASENFGKGFQGINALLGQGKDNLQQFYDIAKQDHQIFSQDQLDQGLKYNRSLHDLQTAFQGLSIEIGAAALPLIKGFADVLTTTVHIMDGVGNAMGGVKISAIAMGAAVGGMVAGPWGAAAGAAFGLVGALGEMHTGIEINTQAIQRMGNAGWDESIRKMRDAGLTAEAFKKVLQDSPQSAQAFIDALDRAGVNTKKYRDELDHQIAGTQKAKQATQDYTDAVDNSTGATKEATKATLDLTKALDSAIQSTEDAADKDLALANSRNTVVKSVGDYAKAEKEAADAGGQNAEKNQALTDQLLQTESAILGTASAARAAAAEHEKQAEAVAGVNDATKQAAAGDAAYRVELDGLRAGLAPDSPLYQYLTGLINNLDNAARARQITLDTSGLEDGVAKVHRLLGELPDRIRIQVGVDALATAGTLGQIQIT